MKKHTIAVTVAGALSVAVLGMAAPAAAAPTAASNAVQAIDDLEAQGYQVIVNRLSDRPLDQATVVSVGKGATFTHTDANAANHDSYTDYDRQFAPDIVMTVYVTVR
ncbi:hypothetical protein BVC93_20380 [Mycobacterium sp. MS1601]|uniref:hypothetical protein n=1 Tax=Mycobacterium sp. MS1601 TaxID=1936029 RepID=UPI0009795F7F|nr:hypothetical protein [Mycobacterium sp. MS1601]AQA04388.1 hypothetical protein BVC93_20380 [Mycobacterium sp. MS1601]